MRVYIQVAAVLGILLGGSALLDLWTHAQDFSDALISVLLVCAVVGLPVLALFYFGSFVRSSVQNGGLEKGQKIAASFLLALFLLFIAFLFIPAPYNGCEAAAPQGIRALLIGHKSDLILSTALLLMASLLGIGVVGKYRGWGQRDSLWNRLGNVTILAFVSFLVFSPVFLAVFSNDRSRSTDARRIADVKQMQLALELYYDAHGQAYPTGDYFVLTSALLPYIPPGVPKDPCAPYKTYEYKGDGQAYVLKATLARKESGALTSDQDGDVMGVWCGTGGNEREYCIQP